MAPGLLPAEVTKVGVTTQKRQNSMLTVSYTHLQAEISLKAGKKLKIEVCNQSEENKYIQAIYWNGERYTLSLIHIWYVFFIFFI